VLKLETFNDEKNVVLLFNVVKLDTFNKDNNVVVFFSFVDPEILNLIIWSDENAVDPFLYPKYYSTVVLVVLFEVLIDSVDEPDKLFKLFTLLFIELFISLIPIGAGGEPPPPPAPLKALINQYQDVT
jgi:hypothetical protein